MGALEPSETSAQAIAYGDGAASTSTKLASDLNDQILSLADLFADSTPTNFVDSSQDFMLSAGVGGGACTPPSPPSITISSGDAPVMGELNSFSMPTITIPPYTVTEPGAIELDYDEAVYQSAIQDALKVALLEYLNNGGTGLGIDVEAALWERKRGERDLLNEKAYSEAEEFIASKNYCMPAGALNGLRTGILAEQTRADTEINLAIAVEQARLARGQSEHTMSMSIAFEGLEKKQFNDVANRTLECAKVTAKVIIDLYLAKMQGYVRQLEAARISVEAKGAAVKTTAAINKATVEAFKANVKAYEAKLLVEVGIVEAYAKLFGFEISGCVACARIASLDLSAQIKEYQNGIDHANNETALSLRESEIAISAYLKAAGLAASAMSTVSGFSSQVIASGLSSITVSASIGDTLHQVSRASSRNTKSSRYSKNCSEIHRYDHTD